MSDQEHAKELLKIARRDLAVLRAMSDVDAFPDAIFGFHAQQSVEKALKAWLASLGKTYPRRHDLKLLLDLLAGTGTSTAPFEALVDLNDFAVQYRYETLSVDAEALDRTEVVAKIEELVSRVDSVLSA